MTPAFALQIGGFRTTSSEPAAGPVSFRVERDMEVAADALEVRLMALPGAAIGDSVELELGYGADLTRVFTGEVAELLPGLEGARLRALGKMGKLLGSRSAATFHDRTAGAIVEQLIRQAGLRAGHVEAGPLLPAFAVDRRRSAWAAVKALADRLGCDLYADRQGAIHFRTHGSALSPAAGLGALASLAGSGGGSRFVYGRHLLRLEAARRPRPVGSVQVGGESPMSTRGATTAHWLTADDLGRGSSGAGSPAVLLVDPVARTASLANAFAAGRLARANRRAHEITLRTLGQASLDLGDSAQVADVPETLGNGRGFIRALTHRFGSADGFTTDARIALEVRA